jgi:hypothetical protein
MDTIDCLACLIWLRYYFVLVVNDYSNINKATPCVWDCFDHNLIIKTRSIVMIELGWTSIVDDFKSFKEWCTWPIVDKMNRLEFSVMDKSDPH